jgi:hypothetical protein
MLQAPQWGMTLKRLAPRAYNLYIQTQANGGAAARRDMLARAGEFHDMRKLDLNSGEGVSIAHRLAWPPGLNRCGGNDQGVAVL